MRVHSRSRSPAHSSRGVDIGKHRLTHNFPCTAAGAAQVEAAEPEWETGWAVREHRLSKAGRAVIVVAPLRAKPVMVTAKVGPAVEVKATSRTPDAAVAAGMVSPHPVTPVMVTPKVGPAAEVKATSGMPDAAAAAVAIAPARTAVALHAILVVAEDRVTVAGKAGPEDAVRAVSRTPHTAAEVVAAMSHRAVPAVVAAGKVGQEAGVAVKMWAADLAEVVVAVDPTTGAVATLPLRDNGIHGVSSGRTRCHLQDTDELAHRASTAMPAVPASFSRSLFVL